MRLYDFVTGAKKPDEDAYINDNEFINEDKIVNSNKIINKFTCYKTGEKFMVYVKLSNIKGYMQLCINSEPSWFVKHYDVFSWGYERNVLSSSNKNDKYGIFSVSPTKDDFTVDVCANKFPRDICDEEQIYDWYKGDYEQTVPLYCLGLYLEAYKQLDKNIKWEDKNSVNNVFNNFDPDLFVQKSIDGKICNSEAIHALKCACIKYLDNSECCQSYKKNFNLIKERPEREELMSWKNALLSEVDKVKENTNTKLGTHSRYESQAF